MTSVPAKAPAVVGVQVTVAMALAPGAIEPGRGLVTAQGVPAERLLSVSGAVPMLVRARLWLDEVPTTMLPKASALVTPSIGAMPRQLSPAYVAPALLSIVIVPLYWFAPVGAHAKRIVALAPGAIGPGSGLQRENGIVAWALASISGAVPGLLTVRTWVARVPTRTSPKASVPGATAIAGAMPVQASATDGAPALLVMTKVPLKTPVLPGVHRTVMVAVPPAAIGPGRAVVRRNGGLVVVPLIVSGAEPVLVTVRFWLDEEPTRRLP
jgi:hypothetical protein